MNLLLKRTQDSYACKINNHILFLPSSSETRQKSEGLERSVTIGWWAWMWSDNENLFFSYFCFSPFPSHSNKSPQIWFSLDWLMQGCNSIHQIHHWATSGQSKRNEALSSWTIDPRTHIPRKQTVTHSAQPTMKHGSKSHSSVPRHAVYSDWHRVKLLYCAAIQRHRCEGEIKSLKRKRPIAVWQPTRFGGLRQLGVLLSRFCNSAVAFLSGILCSDLWHRSLKVEDWSHRAHPITTPQLTLTSDTAGLSSVTEHICQYPGCLYVGRFQALFLPRFIDPLNNLSSLIFPDKLFPLFLTFPVTLNCLGPSSFCFCLRWRWHCGLWGGRGSQHLREIFLY